MEAKSKANTNKAKKEKDAKAKATAKLDRKSNAGGDKKGRTSTASAKKIKDKTTEGADSVGQSAKKMRKSKEIRKSNKSGGKISEVLTM